MLIRLILTRVMCFVTAVFLLQATAFAGVPPPQAQQESAFDLDAQLDALGREELEKQIPEGARELMRKTDTEELSVGNLLGLSPWDFFKTLWELLVERLKKPIRTFAATLGIIVACALIGGLKSASGGDSLAHVFSAVSSLCVLTSVITPILDCIVDTSRVIQDAALFMLSYIPMLSAALAASGSPVTGATYNMFLFSACQIVSQIVAQTLIPLIGIYLALCIAASLVPEIDAASATGTIKSIITWTLGFFLTVFVGLLSVQTMVAQSVDTVTVKTAKFMIGSFVPVVGSALSEAFSAAQGCVRLLRTTMGAYGVIVAVFTFLPIFIQTASWYMLTNLAAVAGDIIGATRVSALLKCCSSALGILIAIILCFALLIIVSTTVVMITGLGAG